MLALTNAAGAYQAQTVDFSGAFVDTVAPPVKNIPIASLTATNNNLFSTANYEFKFFLEDVSLDTDESLHAMFPMQYDLHLCDGASTYDCDTSLVDKTGATEDWNTDDKCSTSGNWVSLDDKAYTLETTDKFSWTISNVGNPEAALTRTAATAWDFDATDSSLFTLHGSWTEKFSLFTFDTSTKLYTARSYGNLNAAYLGFSYTLDRITVNGGSRIQVWAGSYTTDHSIKATTNNGMMASAKVVLTAAMNPRSRVAPGTNIVVASPMHNFEFFSETN